MVLLELINSHHLNKQSIPAKWLIKLLNGEYFKLMNYPWFACYQWLGWYIQCVYTQGHHQGNTGLQLTTISCHWLPCRVVCHAVLVFGELPVWHTITAMLSLYLVSSQCGMPSLPCCPCIWWAPSVACHHCHAVLAFGELQVWHTITAMLSLYLVSSQCGIPSLLCCPCIWWAPSVACLLFCHSVVEQKLWNDI